MKGCVTHERVQLVLDEEDVEDMFYSVVELYKSPAFDPTQDLRVRFRNQPGIDAGGVRRQMFTNVYNVFASSASIGLFYQGEKSLIPRFSVQNVISGLMTILGRIIAHATVLEGAGFPYLSRSCYWYLATGDQDAALEYATVDDIEPQVKDMLQQFAAAHTEEEVSQVKDEVLNYLSQMGSSCYPSLSTQDHITPDILLNEALIKPKPLLDQLAEGLKTLDVLSYVRAHPLTMKPLFVPSEAITPNSVKGVLVKPSPLTSQQEEPWGFLENLRNFLCSALGPNPLLGHKYMCSFTIRQNSMPQPA